jgi:hypothetical protein
VGARAAACRAADSDAGNDTQLPRARGRPLTALVAGRDALLAAAARGRRRRCRRHRLPAGRHAEAPRGPVRVGGAGEAPRAAAHVKGRGLGPAGCAGVEHDGAAREQGGRQALGCGARAGVGRAERLGQRQRSARRAMAPSASPLATSPCDAERSTHLSIETRQAARRRRALPAGLEARARLCALAAIAPPVLTAPSITINQAAEDVNSISRCIHTRHRPFSTAPAHVQYALWAVGVLKCQMSNSRRARAVQGQCHPQR